LIKLSSNVLGTVGVLAVLGVTTVAAGFDIVVAAAFLVATGDDDDSCWLATSFKVDVVGGSLAEDSPEGGSLARSLDMVECRVLVLS
jgi:hypothetical protein